MIRLVKNDVFIKLYCLYKHEMEYRKHIVCYCVAYQENNPTVSL